MYLTNEIGEELFEHGKQLKELSTKKSQLVKKHLIHKISEINNTINKANFIEFIEIEFVNKLEEALANLFIEYEDQENDFYSKTLKTVDLIFNTIPEDKTKVIYLENIIKKIESRKLEVKDIYEKQLLDDKTIDNLFQDITANIISKYHLSKSEKEDFYDIIERTKDIFKEDITNNINTYLNHNKKCTVNAIVNEMDKREIRGNKTREQFLLERSLTENAKKASTNLLNETIEKHQNSAKNNLNNCSTNMIDLIFRLLPDEYKSQKQLLEIIVDTDINERVGNLIEEVTKKLSHELQEKNEDIIQNELYEEKRYREHQTYEFNYQKIDKIYQDVVHEIRIAYDIPEEGLQAKRLDFAILAEDNSTKDVIKRYIENVRKDNEINLKTITEELSNISKDNVSKIEDSSHKK